MNDQPTTLKENDPIETRKWCTYCRKDNHTDVECWSTRPADCPNEQDALIDAATLYAANYDGDDRQDIRIDVTNAFYAGTKYNRAELVKAQAERDESRQDKEFWKTNFKRIEGQLTAANAILDELLACRDMMEKTFAANTPEQLAHINKWIEREPLAWAAAAKHRGGK